MKLINSIIAILFFSSICISAFNSDLNLPEGDEYKAFAEEMPKLIGGDNAVNNAVKYPQEAKDKGIKGKVYILAFINENGTVDDCKVVMGIGGGCDEAAVEAVKAAKFEPAQDQGKNVKVKYSIPVSFGL